MAEIRVLHILASVELSGAETMLRDTGGDWAEYGVHCDVLSTGETPGRNADALRSAGYAILHVAFRKSPSFFYEVARLVRTGSYDVVHVHTERAAFWLEAAARIGGASHVVRTVHTSFPFEGRLRYTRGLQRRVAGVLLGVRHVFISQSVEANEMRRFGNSGIRIENFVDERIYRPAEDEGERLRLRERLGMGDGVLALVSVGRCAKVKRHDAVIEAVAALVESGTSTIYLHVGCGEDEQAERVLASRIGVEAEVRFLGERDDIRDILVASDVFLMPSEYEGLPLALLEAAACGLPSVVVASPWVDGLVEDGRSGIVVTSRGPALDEALLNLANDAPRRVQLGANARAHVLERFERTRWLLEHADLYSVKDGAGAHD